MASSFSDLFTAAQNIVQAINYVASTYLSVQGSVSRADIATAVCVHTGPGRIARISVTTAGAVGAVYDANDAALTTNLLYVIPAAIGVIEVNLPYSYGLVVAPGAAQIVTVSYS